MQKEVKYLFCLQRNMVSMPETMVPGFHLGRQLNILTDCLSMRFYVYRNGLSVKNNQIA
jgi:hypothetical protein